MMMKELLKITKSFNGVMTWEDFNEALADAIAVKNEREFKVQEAMRKAQNEIDEEQSWG